MSGSKHARLFANSNWICLDSCGHNHLMCVPSVCPWITEFWGFQFKIDSPLTIVARPPPHPKVLFVSVMGLVDVDLLSGCGGDRIPKWRNGLFIVVVGVRTVTGTAIYRPHRTSSLLWRGEERIGFVDLRSSSPRTIVGVPITNKWSDLLWQNI